MYQSWFFTSMLRLKSYALNLKRCFLAKESQTFTHDWSSLPNANNSNNAWGVNFNNGNDNNNHVRLVRSGV